MTQISLFQEELEREAITTQKMLAVIPNDRYDWKPHPKSMNIRQLATHIAELPSWIGMVFTTTELDFIKVEYKPVEVNNTATLLELFESTLVEARKHLDAGREDALGDMWTLRSGEKIHSVEPKADVIRMALSQIIHHRAQLGVYLRLLDVPIPGSYGPSADDTDF